MREILTGERFEHGLSTGNRVDLLIDGTAVYPRMLEAIAAAQSYVLLETYIFRDDATGHRFAGALAERARAGVKVYVMYDATGCLGVPTAFFDHLRDAGVRVHAYRGLSRWRKARFRLWHRTHRKILVVDGVTSFTGGLNIANDYESPAHGGAGWRDTHVEIRGPAVWHLQALFVQTWGRETGHNIREAAFVYGPGAAVGSTAVKILGNKEFTARWRIQRAYERAILAATRQIYIGNAYFLPPRRIMRALAAAVRRGVQVTIVLAGESDVPVSKYASRMLYRELLGAGVCIFEWRGPMLHEKAAVIDGVWSSVGSYNFDRFSLFYNLEVSAEIIGTGFGAAMERMFVSDLARCRAIGLADLEHLPLWQRLLGWLFLRLHGLLG